MTSDVHVGRLHAAGLYAAGVAFGLASVWLALRPPGLSFAAASPSNAILELAAGWSVIAVGLATWMRSPRDRLGPLCALAGVAWFLVGWTNPGTGSPLTFTVGLVFSAAYVPLVAHTMLAYPGGRIEGLAGRSTILVGYATNLLLLGLLPTLVSSPANTGCSICPADLLSLGSAPALAATIGRIGLVMAVVWVAVAVLLVGIRLIRATAPARVVGLPVIIPSIAILGLFAVDAVHRLPSGTPGIDDVDALLWQGGSIALVGLALGVASAWVRASRTRARVAGLVVELAGSPAPGGLRDRLSSLLGDPGLLLAYPIGNDRFVDGHGRTVALDAGRDRSITPLVRDGEEVAFLGHRQGLADDPGQMDELVRAARLTLENERLHAVARARLADLGRSRARVVEAGDDERRHLERDLHDGAQQRLVSLAIALRILRARLDGAPGSGSTPVAIVTLDEAEADLRTAIADLRDVAHGIYPAILADEGLAAAVESFAEGSPIQLTIVAMPQERLPMPIEAAAYFLIVEAVSKGRAQRARIDVQCIDGSLVVDVEHDGNAPEAITELEDRIGALDGKVIASTNTGGLVSIHAEIPCGS